MDPDDQQTSLPQLPQDNSVDTSSSLDKEEITKQSIAKIPVPSVAEDSDLIEKEWVERAKQIVDHTRDNPYEQQKALSKIKADYLKKRYNKDIKIAEE